MSTTEQPTDTAPPLPAPQSPAALADLGYFDGIWDADGVFHETPFSPRKPIRMTITAEWLHSGHWLRVATAELATADNPNPLTATYLWGYDAPAGPFIASWFDSNGGRAAQTTSGWVDDTLVFEGTMTNAGYTFPLRDTFTRRGDNEYHHIGEADVGNGWIAVDEETVRRRS